MMSNYSEELNWLTEEKSRLERRLRQKSEDQKRQEKRLLAQLDELKEQRKVLNASVAGVDKEIKDAQNEFESTKTELERRLTSVQAALARKNGEYENKSLEKKALVAKLDAERKKNEPLLQEIASVTADVKSLKERNDQATLRLEESSELPRKIEKMKERLAHALALKPGFFQKITYTENLFAENESIGRNCEALLNQYRELWKQLEPMAFEEQEI